MRDFSPSCFHFCYEVFHYSASFRFRHIFIFALVSPIPTLLPFVSFFRFHLCAFFHLFLSPLFLWFPQFCIPTHSFSWFFLLWWLLRAPRFIFFFPHVLVATSCFSYLTGSLTSPRTNHLPHHPHSNADLSAALHSSHLEVRPLHRRCFNPTVFSLLTMHVDAFVTSKFTRIWEFRFLQTTSISNREIRLKVSWCGNLLFRQLSRYLGWPRVDPGLASIPRETWIDRLVGTTYLKMVKST